MHELRSRVHRRHPGALCVATRNELAKLVPLIPAMKPDEAKTLVGAIQDCMWTHHQAVTFDHRVERELTKSLFTE